MESVFSLILDMSLTASFVIFAILLIRLLLIPLVCSRHFFIPEVIGYAHCMKSELFSVFEYVCGSLS